MAVGVKAMAASLVVVLIVVVVIVVVVVVVIRVTCLPTPTPTLWLITRLIRVCWGVSSSASTVMILLATMA